MIISTSSLFVCAQKPVAFSSKIDLDTESSHHIVEDENGYFVLSTEVRSKTNTLRRISSDLDLVAKTNRFQGTIHSIVKWKNGVLLVEVDQTRSGIAIVLRPYTLLNGVLHSGKITTALSVDRSAVQDGDFYISSLEVQSSDAGVWIAAIISETYLCHSFLNNNLEPLGSGSIMLENNVNERFIDLAVENDKLYVLKSGIEFPVFENIPLIKNFTVLSIRNKQDQFQTVGSVAGINYTIRLNMSSIDGVVYVYGMMMDSLTYRITSMTCYLIHSDSTRNLTYNYQISKEHQFRINGDKIISKNSFVRSVNYQVQDVRVRNSGHLSFGIEQVTGFEAFSYKKKYSDVRIREDEFKYRLSSKAVRDVTLLPYSNLRRTFGRGAILLVETDSKGSLYWMESIGKEQSSKIYQSLSYHLMEGDGELALFYNDTRRQSGGFKYNSLRHCTISTSGNMKCGPADIVPALSASEGIFLSNWNEKLQKHLVIPMKKDNSLQFTRFE